MLPQKAIRWPYCRRRSTTSRPGLGLERVVGVDPGLDEIAEDRPDVAAAVIDHGQAVGVALVDDGFDHGLVVFPPILRREEEVLAVGDVPPDDHPVEKAAGRLDLGLGDPQGELAQPLDEAPDLVGVEPDPEHDVLEPDDAPEHLLGLADAAVDGDPRVERPDRLDPGRGVAGEAVPHPGDLVVAGREIAPVVPGIVEPEGPHLLDRVRVERQEGRHRVGEVLPDHGLEPRPDDDMLGRLLERLEGPDVRVHVRDGDRPVEVVVFVDVGPGRRGPAPGATARGTSPRRNR